MSYETILYLFKINEYLFYGRWMNPINLIKFKRLLCYKIRGIICMFDKSWQDR